jgi:hypothetical protein
MNAPSCSAPAPALGRSLLALVAAAYLACAVALCWLADPRIEQRLAIGLFWLLWTSIAFGLAAWQWRRPDMQTRGPVMTLSVLAVLLAFMPGLSIFRLVPWSGAALLLFAGARAPLLMKTRRGLYLLALAIAVCGAAAATHPRADLSLLYFIVPAWIGIALAVALQHSAAWPLKRGAQWAGALVFVAVSAGLTLLLFLLLPRPPQLWSGEPQRLDLPQLMTPLLPLARLLAPDRMPEAAPYGHDPLKGVAVGKQASAQARQERVPRLRLPRGWRVLLALAVAGLVWRGRHAVLYGGTRVLAWALAGWLPLRSMRLAARMLRWRLTRSGCRAAPQETLREQLARAGHIEAGERAIFIRAVDLYGQARFGPRGASPRLAREMLRTVALGEATMKGAERNAFWHGKTSKWHPRAWSGAARIPTISTHAERPFSRCAHSDRERAESGAVKSDDPLSGS